MKWPWFTTRVEQPRRSSRLYLFGLLTVAIALAELVLCFAGPIAFVQKSSLILFPPFVTGLTDEQESEAAAFLEQQIALTGSYDITSHSFIEEYFIRTDPEYDRKGLKPVDSEEARHIATELELERYGIAWIYASQQYCELYVSIRNTVDGNVIRSGRYRSNCFEDLLQGIGRDGEPLDFNKDLAIDTRGTTFTDFMVLALFALQLSIGVYALTGREPDFLAELVWAPAMILFLFAYIYALSANMDYVQRYIASGGQLRLPKSTALAQLYAVLRYGPLLIMNGLYYVWRTIEKRRRARNERWMYRYLIPWALPWTLFSAALFGFSFPSAIRLDGMGFLAWFCLVPLLLILITVKPTKAVFYGVVFGTLQTLIVNYWHGTYDYVSLHLITIAFVAEYLLFMIALVFLIRASGRWGFLVVPAVWVFFDYIRSIGVLGYPWGIIGTTQYRLLPLIQISSLTGVWGVDFLVLLCNASLAWMLAGCLFGWTWVHRRSVYERRPYIQLCTALSERASLSLSPLAVFVVIFAVSLASGTIILHRVQKRLYHSPDIPVATIVLLQQNTDPRKYEYRENFEKMIALTDQAIAQLPDKPDLVAWPEGGFKLDVRYWSQPRREKSRWGRLVQDFLAYQQSLGTWLVTGTQDHDMIPQEDGTEQRENYNSSILLDPRGAITAFYHKIHLVPFSEYFPLDKERFSGLYALFEKYGISSWGLGEERVVYQHNRMRLATPICFEDAFSDHVRRFVLRDLDVIINMSNDYWSLSPVEGRQHGLIALFRAVENQRPVLRSTSSGYTVYIDAAGRIQPGAPEPYTEGYVIARVPLPERKLTLYTRWGDWFPRLCGAAAALFMMWLAAVKAFGTLRRRHTRRSFVYSRLTAELTDEACRNLSRCVGSRVSRQSVRSVRH
jgi:apolipoprotein N-acyltransferase